VLAKIAEMPEPDRVVAERLQAIITASAPALAPRLRGGRNSSRGRQRRRCGAANSKRATVLSARSPARLGSARARSSDWENGTSIETIPLSSRGTFRVNLPLVVPDCGVRRRDRTGGMPVDTRSAIASARRRARGSTGRPDTVDHDLGVFPGPAAVAARAAGYVAGLARAAADMPCTSAELFQVGKQGPLARLLFGDRFIPAGRVQAGRSLVLADAQAAERVRGAAPARRNGDRG
jgi:hypothetical protein